jgi:hypothetical protein
VQRKVITWMNAHVAVAFLKQERARASSLHDVQRD